MNTNLFFQLPAWISVFALTAGLARAEGLSQLASKGDSDKIGFSMTTESTVAGHTRLRAGDRSFDKASINHVAFKIGQDVELPQAGTLSLGLGYSLADIDRGEGADRAPLPKELQSVEASVGYNVTLSKDWLLASQVGGGSHATDRDLLSKGWGLTASVIGIHTWDARHTFAFGLAYDSLSHDWKMVPVFGLEWKPSENWSVAVGFPKTAVTYLVTKQFSLALAASGDGGTFYVRDDPRPGVASRSLAGSKLEYTEARVGLEASLKINSSLSVSTAVGCSVFHEFKYLDRDFRLRSHGATPFYSVALAASF